MLNRNLKKTAIIDLRKAHEKNERVLKNTIQQANTLHELREKTSKEVIRTVERYINSLANSPKELEKSVGELKLSHKRFDEIVKSIESMDNVNKIGGSTTGAGLAMGTGIAFFGSSAAVGIATTFGTASTGTAIASLSGAAATNAALAWLGGGALAAGGGGIAAGETLLLLAGPIGWGIGGVALAGGAIWSRSKNRKISEEANREIKKIHTNIATLAATGYSIQKIYMSTKEHSQCVEKHLKILNEDAPDNYHSFTEEMRYELGALINNVNALSQLLLKKVH